MENTQEESVKSSPGHAFWCELLYDRKHFRLGLVPDELGSYEQLIITKLDIEDDGDAESGPMPRQVIRAHDVVHVDAVDVSGICEGTFRSLLDDLFHHPMQQRPCCCPVDHNCPVHHGLMRDAEGDLVRDDSVMVTVAVSEGIITEVGAGAIAYAPTTREMHAVMVKHSDVQYPQVGDPWEKWDPKRS